MSVGGGPGGEVQSGAGIHLGSIPGSRPDRLLPPVFGEGLG
jgi:hypothetical protein